MKKIGILILCLVILRIQSSAQTNTYHPFPEDNATWVVDYLASSCFGYCSSAYYQMRGDTLIGANTYHKIYKRNGSFYYIVPPVFPQPGVVGANFNNCFYIGGIRQDTVAKKVYYIDSTMSSDILLCDFSLQVGDTMPTWYNQGQVGTISVIVIDSIMIAGSYRKRWQFNGVSGANNFSLIEGVGWTNDLLGLSDNPDGAIKLACFNGEQLNPYFNDECVVNLNCATIIGNEKLNQLANYQLFPNPVKGSTVLSANISSKNAIYKIYNAQGQAVLGGNFNNQNTLRIELSDLPVGIYYLQVLNNNQIEFRQSILVIE